MSPATRFLASLIDHGRVAWWRLHSYAQREGLARTARKISIWGWKRARRPLTAISQGRLAPALDPHDVQVGLEAENPRRRRMLTLALSELKISPSFSILMPVYNPPSGALDAAIQSVVDQSYEAWTLIVADDQSSDPEIARVLAEWTAREPRITVIKLAGRSGIARATNAAATQATGDVLAFLDHDDVLARDALLHVAIHLDQHPETELLSSDEDKLDASGRRFSPAWKPGWSPELLLSYCYPGHLTAVKAELFRAIGGIREGFDGAQDHDFWLRASLAARRVGHIPQILYHWRVHAGSTAASGLAKPQSFDAGKRAVQEAFHTRGVECAVERPEWAVQAGWGIYVPTMPDHGPEVAALVYAPRGWGRLDRLMSALAKTAYRDLRVYLIANGDQPPDNRAQVLTSHAGQRVELASALNSAATAVDETLLLFLDVDLTPEGERWLSQMVGWGRLPGIGAVGPRVIDASGRVVHAGLALDQGDDLVGPAYHGLRESEPGPMFQARVAGNRSALAIEGLLTWREEFLALGGFDAAAFPSALFDADYCHRLTTAGLRSVLCAEATLIRDQAPTDPYPPREQAEYRRRYKGALDHARNPRLSRAGGLEPAPAVIPASPRSPAVRVLAVSHNLNWEGAPLMLLELHRGLKSRGKVDPVVVSPTDGPLRTLYEDAGIPVIIEPALVPEGFGRGASAQAARTLVRLIDDHAIEVVHVNTLGLDRVVEAAAAVGAPSVWSIHESDPPRAHVARTPGLSYARLRQCLAVPYRVVFTARSSALLLSPWETAANFALIHTQGDPSRLAKKLAGVDRATARATLGLADDDLAVLTLGTVCERKGQQDLVRAFGRLNPEIAGRTVCHVVGLRDQVPYGRELVRLAESLPLDRRDRFRVIPETDETALYWRASDLFVCTSRVESYPRVVIEAMQSGLAIVTTPVFGIAEQVRQNVNALFYEPGRDEQLARRLTSLALDRALLRSLAESAPEVLASLPSHEEMIRSYEGLFLAARESAVVGWGVKQPSVGPRALTASRPARSPARSRF